MKKPCKVVMLPTNEITGISKFNEEYTWYHKGYAPKDLKLVTYYHLYITSDEEIKEGDWGMGFAVGINNVGRGHFLFKHDGSIPSKVNALAEGSKKIIATTDKSIYYSGYSKHSKNSYMESSGVGYLPQIPESFIKAYVEAQGDIKEVLVEYVIGQGQENGETTSIKEWIKTREDNTIIIHRAKTYTREEMEKAYREGFKDGLNKIHRAFEWIQDNL